MRQVTDDERRARLALRHALAPAHRVADPLAAARAITALHATDPATVYLSCWARVDDLAVADVDRALYVERTLVKQLAMRRTLFAFPRESLPAVWASASVRVAGTEHARMSQDVVLAGLAADGGAWLADARERILTALADTPEGLTAQQIRRAAPVETVPGLSNTTWSTSRLLTHLGLTAHVVRATNTGRWHTSRPRWTLTRHWLGDLPAPMTAAEGYRELVRGWLQRFGPGTEADLVWWLGSTKAVVRAALAELGAVSVGLDRDQTGWLLPGDLAEPVEPEPWVALLPVLDATTMGWQGREFYLDRHREALFDRNGNGGTTAWVDGRVVGLWTQDAAGTVQVHFRERVRAGARQELRAEARRLTAWLGGLRLANVFKSPAMIEILAQEML